MTRSYGLPPVNRAEVLRYAGMRGSDEGVETLFDECLREADGVFACRVCYAEFPVGQEGNTLDFGAFRVESADLSARLSGCSRAVAFAATVGIGIDRLIAKYGSVSPAKALLFQAIGTERVERLCDLFDREIAGEAETRGQTVRARFSPGYGDLPLSVQRDLFRVLDCPRRIGLTLGENLLMTPTKSVTAFIGIAE